MNISMKEEGLFFLWSLAFGFCSGFLYHLFCFSPFFGEVRKASPLWQTLRQKPPLKLALPEAKAGKRPFGKAMQFVGDTLYFLLTTALYCVFLFYTHDGVFRFHSLIALIAGHIFYRKTAGKPIFSALLYLYFFLWAGTRYVAFFILLPVFRPFSLLFKRLISFFGKEVSALRHICGGMIQTIYGKFFAPSKEEKKQSVPNKTVKPLFGKPVR
ncbi:MAG: hypothetical protein MJ078_00805 [Clostridia bacterium]|nr:hypothetical protein [Clostridia bacterium]